MLAARRLLRPAASLAAAAASDLALGASTSAWATTTARCAAAAASSPDHPALFTRSFASSNPYPPPDATRGATADLCDVHVPAPVDTVTECPVQIMTAGLFR